MKSQTAKNKLAFNSAVVTELNDQNLNQLHGGSSNLLSLIIEVATYGTWLNVV